MLSHIGDILIFLVGGLCTGYKCANSIYRVLWVIIDTFRPAAKIFTKFPRRYKCSQTASSKIKLGNNPDGNLIEALVIYYANVFLNQEVLNLL